MAAHVPGIAAAGRNGRRVRYIGIVVAGRRHFAARRHVQQITGEKVAPRPGLAERGQRAHNQARVLLAQGFVAEPERRQKARRQGFEDDIRRFRQPPEQRGAVGGFDIECDAAFGRVVVPERQAAVGVWNIVEKRPELAARRTAGRLDLDHVGAEIAEQFAAELTGFVRQFENTQAGQRTGQWRRVAHPSISSMYGKRGRRVGQNVPSAKPARSSSWL